MPRVKRVNPLLKTERISEKKQSWLGRSWRVDDKDEYIWRIKTKGCRVLGKQTKDIPGDTCEAPNQALIYGPAKGLPRRRKALDKPEKKCTKLTLAPL